MAKIQIKSEKLTPFGGIFSIMEQFDALLAQTIDSTLGLRCTLFGYQYSEILRSLLCVYLCGGKERIFDDMNETSKMDEDITQACIEHLLRQQCLCQPVQDRLWLKAMLFWLNRRIQKDGVQSHDSPHQSSYIRKIICNIIVL